jgi:hypothetical protein
MTIISQQPCDRDNVCFLPMPASTCESPTTLVYYSNARCAADRCQWQKFTLSCPCFGGGCQSSTASDGGINVVVPDVAAGSGGNMLDDAAPDHGMVAVPDGGSCSDEDASVCEIPASMCADNQWLAYFTNVTCAAGQCRWEVAYRDCGGRGCAGNGCIPNFTK